MKTITHLNLLVSVCAWVIPAFSQSLDPVSTALNACVADKKREFVIGTRQNFEQVGEITCNSADVVDFPPRERRDDRDAVVSYSAPEGYSIVNESAGSIVISDLSSVSGSYGVATISGDGKTVSVPISCRGRGLTEGRAWQKIAISGQVEAQTLDGQIIDWTLACAKAIDNSDQSTDTADPVSVPLVHGP